MKNIIAFFKKFDPNAWIEFPDEDGQFAAAEDNMIDVASGWAMDDGQAVRLPIKYWMNNVPVFEIMPDCMVYSAECSRRSFLER